MELTTSTSSPEDTLANLSPSQVEKKVSKIRDTSGQSILDLSKNSDQLGSLEKMLVDTLNKVSTPYSRTWKVKVTPRGHLVFQLLASAQTTKENESGFWRTPDAHCGRGANSEERMKMKLEKKMPISLNDQVAHPNLMWPTPNARDWKDSVSKVPPSVGKTRGHSLGMKVAEREMWPTPTARDWKDTGENTNYEKIAKKGKLAGAVKMWPTPNASDNRDRGNLSDPAIQRRIKMGKQVGLSMAVKEKKGGGTLNPTWVEWLMGYPTGWTDLER
jgi:hypothetical protein